MLEKLQYSNMRWDICFFLLLYRLHGLLKLSVIVLLLSSIFFFFFVLLLTWTKCKRFVLFVPYSVWFEFNDLILCMLSSVCVCVFPRDFFFFLITIVLWSAYFQNLCLQQRSKCYIVMRMYIRTMHKFKVNETKKKFLVYGWL